MENLLALLDKIQHVSPLPIFEQETIVVQNAGMQHWLNLSLANIRGISMNVDYALPSQFLWKLVRSLASRDKVPDQSPYSREVLSWRIFSLLQSESVLNNEDFTLVNQYWGSVNVPVNSTENTNDTNILKCYQLATQLADLYEQYLIFRPQWIDAWHQGDFKYLDNTRDNSDGISDASVQYAWQGRLWHLLTSEQPYNPIELIQSAIEHLPELAHTLPQRICFFGINAMPPIWLSFIHQLSDVIDIHFFHLNPCYSYWGDILTEKQAISALNKWSEGYQDISQDVGNPLLANLGQQGREFMALLQQYSTVNIDVFEQATVKTDVKADIVDGRENSADDARERLTVLQHVQNDILNLIDARTLETKRSLQDESIVVSSAHSALREVQGLHDYLLHQCNSDPDLSPKDILVMCPQVEDYAPYVNSVFAKGWQNIDNDTPPIPCSISDRISKDAVPVVAAFSSLLTLPDSRFQVSQLLSYLRLPALQAKYNLNNDDIEKFTQWLAQASVHWGLNAEHKSTILQTSASPTEACTDGAIIDSIAMSNQFTWEQGLAKLLKGFAYSDETALFEDELLLPNVEGDDARLLGDLMLIIEQIQSVIIHMKSSRTAIEWQTYLTSIIEQLFSVEEDTGFEIIHHAIKCLAEYCEQGKYSEKIDWLVVKDFLEHHFSQPDPGRQFMIGQVTFCSMLPMRSIPFKVIAVLGLNDGVFPRQRQPMGFDLMDITPAKIGDRSRRGDDRYLFLEALISARQSLYLSFQGRNIKNNAEKQPSLVLKELMEYLSLGYGWDFQPQASSVSSSQLLQLPMQPFSVDNYVGKYPSFDAKWLALMSLNNEETETQITSGDKLCIKNDVAERNTTTVTQITLTIDELIRFFQHPSKVFAQRNMSLFFNDRSLTIDDEEPFVADALQTYLLKQSLVEHYLTQPLTADENNDNTCIQTNKSLLKMAQLSGKFPDFPTTPTLFEKWDNESERFSLVIKSSGVSDITTVTKHIKIQVDDLIINIAANFPVSNNSLVFYRSSSPKWKDYFTLYVHQLLLQVVQEQKMEHLNTRNNTNIIISEPDLAKVKSTNGYYFDSKSQKNTQYVYNTISDHHTQLHCLLATYCKGLNTPLLLNGDLSEKYFKSKNFTQSSFEQLWADPNSYQALGDDPYIQYFWPQCPDFSSLTADIEKVYQQCFNLREQLDVE